MESRVKFIKNPTAVFSGVFQQQASRTSAETHAYIRGGSVGRSHSSSDEGVDRTLKTPKLRSRTGTAIDLNFLDLFDEK